MGNAIGQAMTQQTIPICTITFDVATTVGDVQLIPRHEYDLAAIRRYRKALIEGRSLPAIVVFEIDGRRILGDGRHRVRAHMELGRLDIHAILIPAANYTAAVQHAWGALNEALAATGAFHQGECP